MPALFGQTSTATIEGFVHDSSGAAIPGAKVTITNTSTGVAQEVPTNGQGSFAVPYLQPGEYSVAIEKGGFRGFRETGVRLDVQQVRSFDVELAVGELATTVHVDAAAPPLATSTSTAGATIETKQIADLPLNGRNVMGVVLLVPGTSPGEGSAGSSVARSPWISGGRNSTGEIRLDGGAMGVPGAAAGVLAPGGDVPSVDSVQEVAVLTNNLAAEYGRTGGGVILIASKQGTNSFHGTGYWFVRNSALDANNFFSNRAGIPLSSLERNQAGGSVGGPVFVPRLYDGRNRTFFFFDYESTRQITPDNLNTTVPLDAWKNGDFSNLRTADNQLIAIFDPQTIRPDGTGNFIRDAFPGNKIPVDRMDPVARNLMKFYPGPNTAPINAFTQVNNFFVAGNDHNNAYRMTTRLDHNFSNHWRTFLRLTRSISETDVPVFFGNDNPASPGGRGNTHGTKHALSWDHTITINPTTIVDINYGLSRLTQLLYPPSLGFDPTTIGLPAYLRDQAAKRYLRFPTVAVSGLSQLGQQTGAGLGQGFTSHNLIGSVTKVLSKHTIKAGGEYRVLPLNQWSEGVPEGSFSFNETWTQQNPVKRVATQGFGLASLLLGLPNSGSQSLLLDPAVSSRYFAAYLQDDFRVSRKLTLNIGVRYEVDLPRTERYNRMSYFDLSAPSPIAGKVPSFPNLVGAMQFTGANQRTQTPVDWNNVGPRFGFAYKIDSKMVARGGYALTYAPSIMQAATSNSGFEGFDSTTSMIVSLDGRTPLNYLRNPFPDGFSPALGPAVSPVSGPYTDLGQTIQDSWFIDHSNPVLQQWNFNLQRELPGSIIVEAAYLGSKGNHQIDGENTTYNQLPAADFALGNSLNDLVPNPFYGVILDPTSTLSKPTVQRGQLLRPYPQYAAVTSKFRPTGNSLYHAFTLRLEKRFSRGLSFLLSYTAAKMIDDSGFGSTLDAINGTTARQDAYDRKADRAVSSEDISSRLALSFNYELPVGRGRAFLHSASRPLNAILGGWQVNGIVTAQSGLPVAIFQNANNTGLFTAAQRPNNNGHSAKISGGTTDQRLAEWFNPAVFSIAPPFTFGNAPRVLPDVRNPGLRNLDCSLFKNFRFLHERLTAQFRLEAFNALNKTQFGPAAATVGTTTIGVISSTAVNARQVQIAMKAIF
jgi:hypothetical protein